MALMALTAQPGQSGLDGIDALGEKPGAVTVLAFNNAVTTPPESDAVSERTISMHDYFVGGNEPKFSATGGGTAVALAWDDAGVELTITVTRADDDAETFPTTVSPVVLTAEDDDGRSASVEVMLRANLPPTAISAPGNIRIGLQQDKLTTARNTPTPWTCNTSHICTRSLAPLFESGDTGDLKDVLTYEATSDDTSKVAASVDGDMLTITAIATTAVTADDTTTNGADEAVEVTLKATDAGDLSVTHETKVSVLVDSPPTLKNAVPFAATYALTEALAMKPYTLVNAAELGRVFEDDGVAVAVTSESISTTSSDDAIASATTNNGLVITVKARGMVTITLTATEGDGGNDNDYGTGGVGQTAKQEITFEVVAP